MESLESQRDRIQSAESLHGVVRLMKAMAAMHIQRHEAAAAALADYLDVVGLGFQALFARDAERIAIADAAPEAPAAVVVFGSDIGLVGQFNEVAADRAADTVGRLAAHGRGVVVLTVGRRVAAALRNRPEVPVPAAVLAAPRSAGAMTDVVYDLLLEIEPRRERDEIGRIVLVFHEHQRGRTTHAITRQLFPMEVSWLAGHRRKGWPTRTRPMIPRPEGRLLATLVRDTFFAGLYHALAESLASESASRLAAMHSAEQNLETLIDRLHARFRESRQKAITAELLDIVAGYEVLESEELGEA